MPIRNIRLTTARDAFIDRTVGAGTCQDASEAAGDAAHPPRQHSLDDATKLKELQRHISTGPDDLARGDFIQVDTDDLETLFAQSHLEPSV